MQVENYSKKGTGVDEKGGKGRCAGGKAALRSAVRAAAALARREEGNALFH